MRSIEELLWYVNYDYLNHRQNGGIMVEIVPVNEVEMDEKWRFAGDKSGQYWLWWAIEHTYYRRTFGVSFRHPGRRKPG
jgi:hypothetical protein